MPIDNHNIYYSSSSSSLITTIIILNHLHPLHKSPRRKDIGEAMNENEDDEDEASGDDTDDGCQP